MKESLLTLGKDALNSLRDLTPIVSVIVLFQVFVFRTPVSELLSLAYGGILVIVGLTFFIFGLRVALFPVGSVPLRVRRPRSQRLTPSLDLRRKQWTTMPCSCV